jgi:crotonobetainyl-CoA:carnitine CoA-transferase CaiB-like acyl-CoA transferase
MGARDVTAQVWQGLGDDAEALERLTITGPEHTLASPFAVTAAAVASVAAATLATAELWHRRGGPLAPTSVDSRHVAVACCSERYVAVEGRDLGDVWDPIAGVYRATDGWVRLHTNFRAHRAAALRALGLDDDADRAGVAATVAAERAHDLEQRVYDAGGCAAALRSMAEWRASAQAQALGECPLVAVDDLGAPATGPDGWDGSDASGAGRWLRGRGGEAPRRPLDGVRVLDMTRVIAGPVAGRFLAAHGADVVRIDGPVREDSAVLVADTTVGKRATAVDLAAPDGRAAFAALLDRADVVLCAYRPGALGALGLDPSSLARMRPGLVVGTLSAYGGAGVGPWGERRGFDSLVQMVTGIADEGRRALGGDGDGEGGDAGDDAPPVPLPVQLLDHASGYLLAAGVLRALARGGDDGRSREVKVSLARTSCWLDALGRDGAVAAPPLPAERPDDLAVRLRGPLGTTHHIACPGSVEGAPARWASGPVLLGHDAPTWAAGGEVRAPNG